MVKWIYWHGGKRLWDIAGAFLCLLLALLPLGVCMLLIRWETPGPALLGQVRVGLHGRVFRLWKLRTMRHDAEGDGRPRFALESDPRATRVGAWLRAWHGDELPQLWNVLCGDMSLVGPRPERPCFVERFRDEIPDYDRRHCIRPGITGWAQVNTGYAGDCAATRIKTRFDLAYLQTAGWNRDWRIWCLTWRVAGASLRRHRAHRAASPVPAPGRAAPAKRRTASARS
ncbi:MAG TPA: sugar transferase [Terriglobales bacterium]|nr:sugar transferase [Terriglobales bacterium]